MIYLTAVVAGLLFAYLITAMVNVSGHTDGFRYGSQQQIRRSPLQVRIGSVLTPPQEPVARPVSMHSLMVSRACLFFFRFASHSTIPSKSSNENRRSTMPDWSRALSQRLVNADEVVPERVERDHVTMIFEFL